MQKKFIQFIPNLFTLGNLFLGCLGIIFCFNDRIFPVQLNQLDPTGRDVGVIFGFNNQLYLASFMIFGASVLDYLDGFVARALNAQSALGVQLDSLADAVTFGVLPACIYFQLLSGAYHLEPNALYVQTIYLLPAFLIALCAVYRLAKFNVDERQHESFIGLATPAMGLFAATLPLIVFTNAFGMAIFILNKWVLYGLVISFSWLMVAEIPMFSFKIKSFKWKGNETQISFLIISLLLIIFLKYAGIAASILLYIFICLIKFFISPKKEVSIPNS
ncbi:MAG: CDP-alcohol phosphatidyltransferase family protein [Chitinophagales bacterium]|nr:CDP-alcohol phosphatidyltransferase family protein [Chitinophagales bacterium]